jgi:hypothetical protein
MEGNKRIISYSLYGNNQRYTLPLLENSKIVLDLYPGWIIYVYHDDSVSNEFIELLNLNGVFTINIEKCNYGSLPPKMWRFLPVKDNDVDCVIFRDADSALTSRESDLVIKWIESEKDVHIIRDHPLHIAPILAGMFGLKRNSFKILSKLLDEAKPKIKQRPIDYDQVFLADYLYPKVVDLALIHVSFFRYWDEQVIKIKGVSDGYNYIGSVEIGDNLKREEEKNILLKSKFVIGIPYFVGRLFRYRVRPIIYCSKFLNFLIKF